jgi:hypothetical protein
MMDVSKIRVGDNVTVRGVVVGLVGDAVCVCFVNVKGPVPVRHEDIVSHIPAPREFKREDEVRNTEQYRGVPFFILSTFGAWAWVRDTADWVTQFPISELRHADDAPDERIHVTDQDVARAPRVYAETPAPSAASWRAALVDFIKHRKESSR